MAVGTNTENQASTPGLVCAHSHAYSALARGMPAPPATPTNFADILKLVWWRLDRALDADIIYHSARLAALNALESGSTAVIDHHESPNFIEGSLSIIADAFSEVGVRVNVAYGITNRHGPDGAAAGLAENDRFLSGGGKGLVGLHASFTCEPETIAAAAELADKHGVGVHVHVAEGSIDTWQKLQGHTNDKWMLIHGVHLPDEHELLGTIVHNPRSNMNNSVGYANPSRFSNPVALGTDGIGADMIDEFRLAFVKGREHDVTTSPDVAWGWLEAGWDLFPEAKTDRVTWNYDPMDAWRLAYTTNVHPTKVEIGGETVFAEGRPTKVDADEIRAKSAEAAQRLFAKLEEME